MLNGLRMPVGSKVAPVSPHGAEHLNKLQLHNRIDLVRLHGLDSAPD
jgi:hypothetical protein